MTEDDVDWSIQSNRSSSTRLQSQNRHKLEIGKIRIFYKFNSRSLFFCSLLVSYLLVANQSVAEKTDKIVVVRALRKGQGLKIRC